MATPIGHLLAGQVAYRVGSEATGARSVALAALCWVSAVAPDLDFLPGFLVGTPALFHQGVSHSIFVGLAFAIVLAILYRGITSRLPAAVLVVFLAYLSHLILDLFGPDHRPPYGIPLFWPLSQTTYLSPTTLLPGVHHASTTGTPTGIWVTQTLQMGNALVVAVEVGLLAPFVLAGEIWAWRARVKRGASGKTSDGRGVKGARGTM